MGAHCRDRVLKVRNLAEPDRPQRSGGIPAPDMTDVLARRDEGEEISRRMAALEDAENDLNRARPEPVRPRGIHVSRRHADF